VDKNRNDITTAYRQAIAGLTKQHAKVDRRIKSISLIRILVFLAGVFFVYLATGFSMVYVAGVLLVFILAFAAVVLWHAAAYNKRDGLARLLKINKDELKAMNGDYSVFDDGNEFADDDHHFAGDLDIFGSGSVFQYLNRTSTVIGKNKLAGWFLNPEKDVEAIKQRQKAVNELKEKTAWRQRFRSTGLWLGEKKSDKESILNWMDLPVDFQKPVFTVMLFLIPALSVLMLVLLIFGQVTIQLFLLYLIIPLGIAFSQSKKIQMKHELVSRKSELLRKYSRLFTLTETEHFESPLLKKLRENLKTKHHAGEAVGQLSRIVNALDVRLNVLAWFFLNYFMLWDILQARRLEHWRTANRGHAARWFDTLSETDALVSLGCFAYNHPDFTVPVPVKKAFLLRADACGHPLIRPEKRVDNPVDFTGWNQFIIITGANMAGKSTYLRTVAVNFILAMVGAPVCAVNFTFSPAYVFTSIRTRDDLLHNESYFFAELKRLKAMIDELEQGSRLFIVLDEILKGTNSKDKQTGSKALLKQLIRYGASGLIATHDLELGRLINEYPENIRNKRFEVEINNDQLEFDYRLKEGVSRNLNATFLMKKMGITL
jgi:hypothetical protein